MRRLFALFVLAATLCSPAAAFDFSRYGTTTYRDVTAGRVVAPPGSGTPGVVDLRSAATPLETGTYLSGNGSEFSFCSWLGCEKTYDINIAQAYVRGKTKRNVLNAETVLALDNYSNTGFVPNWKPNKVYAAGDRVINTGSRYLYQATVAGTSGSGPGPTVVGSPIPTGNGPTTRDGTVTWQYIMDADYTDAKTTLNITTAVGPNAGHTWGQAENVIMLPGVQTDLVVGHETDFGNLDQDCDLVGRNCFMNLLFAQGHYTSTAFFQMSGGSDSPAIPPDNSTGGAMLTGINLTGANTIRGVAFSDGTNSANTLKGYIGTRHISGFISDESTSPISYRTAGTNSYAAWSDTSTSPYAVRYEGNYGIGAWRYKDTILGPWDGDKTYAALTFNATFSPTFMNGVWGKNGDPNLYVNTQGSLQLKVSGQPIAVVSSAGLALTGGTNINGQAGATCSGPPTANYAVNNGIVIRC